MKWYFVFKNVLTCPCSNKLIWWPQNFWKFSAFSLKFQMLNNFENKIPFHLLSDFFDSLTMFHTRVFWTPLETIGWKLNLQKKTLMWAAESWPKNSYMVCTFFKALKFHNFFFKGMSLTIFVIILWSISENKSWTIFYIIL